MKNKFFPLLMALMCVVIVGCGPGYTVVPVSGKVTVQGKPAAGIKVVFYPKGTESNPAPGPFSQGQTDENGVFTLTTRDGAAGAIVGDHRVALEMFDEGLDQETLDEAKGELEEAVANGDKESIGPARKRYMQMKKKFDKAQGIPAEFLDGSKTFSVTVPAGGTSEADLDF